MHRLFGSDRIRLSGDIVTNLQYQIDGKVNVSDKATTAEAQAGTNDTKWMTPLKVKNFVDQHAGEIVDGGVRYYPHVRNLLTYTDYKTQYGNPTTVTSTLSNITRYYDVGDVFVRAYYNDDGLYIQAVTKNFKETYTMTVQTGTVGNFVTDAGSELFVDRYNQNSFCLQLSNYFYYITINPSTKTLTKVTLASTTTAGYAIGKDYVAVTVKGASSSNAFYWTVYMLNKATKKIVQATSATTSYYGNAIAIWDDYCYMYHSKGDSGSSNGTLHYSEINCSTAAVRSGTIPVTTFYSNLITTTKQYNYDDPVFIVLYYGGSTNQVNETCIYVKKDQLIAESPRVTRTRYSPVNYMLDYDGLGLIMGTGERFRLNSSKTAITASVLSISSETTMTISGVIRDFGYYNNIYNLIFLGNLSKTYKVDNNALSHVFQYNYTGGMYMSVITELKADSEYFIVEYRNIGYNVTTTSGSSQYLFSTTLAKVPIHSSYQIIYA